MKPYLFLNELGGKNFDKRLRKAILDNDFFRSSASEVDRHPIKATIEAREIMNDFIGSCTECGGRMRSRSGPHFDHEDICIICYNTCER